MILVTGGTGLLGAHLLYHLLQKESRVKALKRVDSNIENVRRVFQGYGDQRNELFNKIEWVEGDILDYYELLAIMDGISHVYHTAALVSFTPSDEEAMMHTNVRGTANVVDACLTGGIEKLCHVSSISALGSSKNGDTVTETLKRNIEEECSHYSMSKYHGELEVWRGIEEGLKAVIVNPSVILGHGNWDTGTSNLFSLVWKGLKYYTHGCTGFIDAGDLCKCMILLMNDSVAGERFIISAENVSYQHFFNMVSKKLNRKPPSVYASPFLSGLAWRLEAFRCKMSGKKPLITRISVKTAHETLKYSSDKFLSAFNYSFKSVEQIVEDIGNQFLREKC